MNIDFNEKPTPPPPEPIPPPVPIEKAKKSKKKKTIVKEEETKPKRNDYKELAPAKDDEAKPKKKKTKDKKPAEANHSAPLLLDMLSDDINPISQSNHQSNGQAVFQSAGQSDHLIIVSPFITFHKIFFFFFSGIFHHSFSLTRST